MINHRAKTLHEALLRLPEEMLRSLALVTSLQYYRPGTVHC